MPLAPFVRQSRKFGFTLSEVLITLGIIGVVAAITLPSFFINLEVKKLIPQVQKSYSTLAQCVAKSQVSNAATDHWNYNQNGKAFFEEYLKECFIISGTATVQDLKNKDIVYYNMDSSVATDGIVNNDNSYVAIIPDGTYLFISEDIAEKYKTIAFDVNGIHKPNIIGKDTFMFVIQGKYGLTPYGYGEGGVQTFGTKYEVEKLLRSNPYGCHNIGAFCSAYLISKGWEMGNDYPR